VSFWDGMLDCERRDNQLRQYNELTFINDTQESYPIISAKRKFRPKQAATIPSTINITASLFEETDETFIDGIDESLGTTIGRTARNLVVTDRKSRYFNALGMNGVIDLSDNSSGSQLSNFNQDTQAKVKQQFPTRTISQTNNIIDQLEELQKAVHDSRDDKSYLKKYIGCIKQAKTTEKYNITKRLYTFVLELLLYDSYIFDEDEYKLLSEGDYQVKIWGPLMETIFRGSGIILHWGDTIPSNCKRAGKKIKMDLRVIANTLTKQDVQADTGAGELAKEIEKSKFYKDKLKAVLSSKLNINQRLDKSPAASIDPKTTLIPFIIIMGFEAVVYTLYLACNGLYVVDEVATISVPTSVSVVKDHGIGVMVSGLEVIKV
jgi:hypothetical protein